MICECSHQFVLITLVVTDFLHYVHQGFAFLPLFVRQCHQDIVDKFQ